MEWFINVHRKMLYSEIWHKPPWWIKVWMYLLLKAPYKPSGVYDAWEFYFTYGWIADECGVWYDTVRRCIEWLKNAKQINTQKTARGLRIRVLNYDKFQGSRQAPTQSPTQAGTHAIEEERRKKKEEIYNSKLPTGVDEEIWNDYVDMRKKMKKPMTQRAMALAIKKLEWFPESDRNQILENSVMNSWLWLFAIENKTQWISI